MDPSDDVELPGPLATASSNGSLPDQGPKERNHSATDILMRIEKQMSIQCFEMLVKVHAENNRRACSVLDAERDLPVLVNQLEEEKTVHFFMTTTHHRSQISKILAEHMLKEDDPKGRQRYLVLLEDIERIHKESQDLNERIIELRKQRLELKRLTHEKLKEADDLLQAAKRVPQEEEKKTLKKAQITVEKYNKMVAVTQNVLRGILLGCDVNWMDDPKVRDILLSDNRPTSE